MEHSALFEQCIYYISYNVKKKPFWTLDMYYKEAGCLNGKKHTHGRKKSK